MIRTGAVVACLMSLQACGRPQQNSHAKFSAGEHLILGDAGYSKTCGKRGDCRPSFARADGIESYTYGELIAFSADFYDSAEELFKEKQEPWYKVLRNNISSTRKLFQEEVKAAQEMMDGHADVSYPDFSKSFAFNYSNYVNLAEHNEDHFGFYNIRRYVNEHQKALELAIKARELKLSNSPEADEALRYALFQSAFADHFLTDGFASGHIRNPRRQTLNWADKHGYSRRTAAALSKIVHDRDGEVRDSGEHGLPVLNSRGDEWFARCDSQLFFKTDPHGPAVNLVVESVEISLEEFFAAYDTGHMVDGKFAAINLVPFPHHQVSGLVDTVQVDRFLPRKAYDAMAWYMHPPFVKDFSTGAIESYYKAIPEIMETMRSDIAAVVAAEPNLRRHLPEAYLDAYQDIR